jgi:hypothetical protein
MTCLSISKPSKDWKKRGKSGFQKKGFNSFSYKNSRKSAQFDQTRRSVQQQNFPSQSGNRPIDLERER